MWEKQNEEIHTSAEVRQGLHSAGIINTIELLKAQSQFSFCLSREECDFFGTPLETTLTKRKRECNQLEWIARGEQFLPCMRLSMRLQNLQGMMYCWLANDTGHRNQQR